MGGNFCSELEPRLSHLFGAEYAVLFGRARSGLVAALGETTPLGAPVIIPSNVCSVVLAAVVAAERQPVLAPVSAELGLVDDCVLAKIIEAHDGHPGMVLITHLYGMVQSYPMTESAAQRAGWRILENDSLAATALSPGGTCVTSRMGLLVSFGTGKFLDGGGGGAIMTNDHSLAIALLRRAAAFPVFNDAAAHIENHVLLARRHLTALGIPEASEPILAIEAANCRYSFDPRLCEPLLSAIDALPVEYARRMERLEVWRTILGDVARELSVPHIPVQAPWRAVFRAGSPRLRDGIVAALRAAGFDAGTNYPPLWNCAPRLVGTQQLPSGDCWGASVLTLWLSDTYNRPRIQAAADLIKKTIVAENQNGQCQ